MKIGYPCINTSIGCTANSTFRLANYSEENMISKIENNLSCLEKILDYNIEKGLLFFRISSDLVPFASHPICKFKWQEYFKERFKKIGKIIKENNFRISMHPDQFVLLNSPNDKIVQSSIRELEYHCQVLDLMGLDSTAKVQIHVGGAYSNKEESIERFISKYNKLPELIKKRLVIENDDKIYGMKDCLKISSEIGIPIIFDSFHHSCLNDGEKLIDAINMVKDTWTKKDGILMSDYSSQEKNAKKGTHTRHIDIADFENYLKLTTDIDFDIMLEIKDKEKSAIKALGIMEKIRK